MKPQETIDFYLRWAWHSIARLYNDEAEKHGLTMSNGYVLLNIDIREGTPSTKLGPKMGMEPRSLTRTLKNMEDQGLIYRKTDKKDKRMVRIMLSDLGKKKREIAKKSVIAFNEYVQSKLNTEELDAFFRVMEKINHLLKQETHENFFKK
jgi:DNA-binding MarR family transcriptional regulator